MVAFAKPADAEASDYHINVVNRILLGYDDSM